MNYSFDLIYKLVGRDDEVVVITFSNDSEECKDFGVALTVVFEYTKSQREKFEKRFLEQIDSGEFEYLKVKSLGNNLSKDKEELLMQKGINTASIVDIFSMPGFNKNLFHKPEKRLLNELNIQLNSEPKGGEYDWIYGFYKKQFETGVMFFKDEINRFLAMKFHFEPSQITADDKALIFKNGAFNEEIEWYLLELKFDKEIITEVEEIRWKELFLNCTNKNVNILMEELQNAGIKLKELANINPIACKHLINGTYKFIEKRLNCDIGKPIYIDWKGYLHIFLRHVEGFKIGKNYSEKDIFLLNPKDVIPVVKKVIDAANEEIQTFWKSKPYQRFSKYGDQSLYFLGDYYTFHIEGNGRLSTFHISKNKI
jgi:hypothetical protein